LLDLQFAAETMNRNVKNFKVTLSRNFNDPDIKSMPTKSPPAVDANHVHIYLSCANSNGPHAHQSVEIDCPSSHSEADESTSADGSVFFNQCSNGPTSSEFIQRPSSSVPHSRSASHGSISYSGQAVPAPRRGSCLEKAACQVYDYLFMSGVEAAFNAHLLCKYNIEFLIDLTNLEPCQVPRHKKSDVPCVCPRETAHSRARMTITVDEQSTLDLTPYFEDANRFIDSARACGKAVLIYSFNGRNRCAVFVVQYIMKVKGLSCDRAVQLLREKCPNIHISENFYRSLRKWDVTLNLISASHAPAVAKRSSPFIKKTAWL
ncbi:Dual specificity protein phosphatase 8, partial [Trichinella nativa]